MLEIIEEVTIIEFNYINNDLVSTEGSAFIIALGKCRLSFSFFKTALLRYNSCI